MTRSPSPAEGCSTGVLTHAAGSEEMGRRLSNFAVGCLQVTPTAKFGSMLGLMGSTTEEEFKQVLRHLETLTLQRSAGKLGKLLGEHFPTEQGATNQCSSDFAKSLQRACGADLDGIFRRLPLDRNGRADLLRVFGMSSAPKDEKSGEKSSLADACADMPVDYIERAIDLPRVTSSMLEVSTEHLSSNEVAQDWTCDVLALNTLRSSLALGCSDHQDECWRPKVDATLIKATSVRCGSKRPALSKCALRMLAELAECEGASAANVWDDAAGTAFSGCLQAIRATKLTARMAEETLTLVAKRVAKEAGLFTAVKELTGCIDAESQSKVPQAPVVVGGLRAVRTLLDGLGANADQQQMSHVQEIADLTTGACDSVLETRRLAAAFAEARATKQSAASQSAASRSRTCTKSDIDSSSISSTRSPTKSEG